MIKIGILTLPFGANYGCLLQSYALYEYLRDLGYDVTVLSRGWNRTQFGFMYNAKRWFYYNVICKNLYAFYNKINRSPLFRDSDSLREYVKKSGFDVVIVGSDQVWRVPNTRGANLNYFLDFLENDNSIKKIAYAASFGTDQFEGTNQEKESISRLIKLFNHISVREESGVQICEKEFNIDADCVLDPTMLLTKEKYIHLCLNTPSIPHNTIVTYLLDPNDQKKFIVNSFSAINKTTVVELYKKTLIYKSVEYWLKAILEAEFVVVDSFHGMIFSILFEKQFVVINNKKRGSTRFSNVLNKLGLNSRCINEEDVNQDSLSRLYNTKIDYSKVSQILANLRNDSNRILCGYLNK